MLFCISFTCNGIISGDRITARLTNRIAPIYLNARPSYSRISRERERGGGFPMRQSIFRHLSLAVPRSSVSATERQTLPADARGWKETAGFVSHGGILCIVDDRQRR